MLKCLPEQQIAGSGAQHAAVLQSCRIVKSTNGIEELDIDIDIDIMSTISSFVARSTGRVKTNQIKSTQSASGEQIVARLSHRPLNHSLKYLRVEAPAVLTYPIPCRTAAPPTVGRSNRFLQTIYNCACPTSHASPNPSLCRPRPSGPAA